MFRIVGVTPEAMTLDAVVPEGICVPSICLPLDSLASRWEELNSAGGERVDLVSRGNPHFSLGEIERLASLCGGRIKHAHVEVLVTCGRFSRQGQRSRADSCARAIWGPVCDGHVFRLRGNPCRLLARVARAEPGRQGC
ncbi:aconitase X [Pararhizobium sp. PWRC1-1]|uniref:aconitase X n=1 Tax=Pararhizobium sp. PWRC1-1 TaxID=2804566 RepID=UPI003CF213CF